MDQLEDLQFLPPPPLRNNRSVSNKLPGDAIYYLGPSDSLLSGAGRRGRREGWDTCDSFFSKFHRARRVHAVDVALVHGDDEHEVVRNEI
jgi:hypothetical protein